MLDKIKREIVKPVIIQKLKIISGELKLEKLSKIKLILFHCPRLIRFINDILLMTKGKVKKLFQYKFRKRKINE